MIGKRQLSFLNLLITLQRTEYLALRNWLHCILLSRRARSRPLRNATAQRRSPNKVPIPARLEFYPEPRSCALLAVSPPRARTRRWRPCGRFAPPTTGATRCHALIARRRVDVLAADHPQRDAQALRSDHGRTAAGSGQVS